MTYDEMITAVEALNTQQQVHRDAIPHGSNLLHQFNKKEAGKEAMYEDMLREDFSRQFPPVRRFAAVL